MAHPAHGRLGHELAVLLDPLAAAVGLLGYGPANLGTAGDYRVPDHAYLREPATTVFVPTAALVVEILSPGDETWDKLPFHFALGVEELLVVDPGTRTVQWLVRGAEGLERSPASKALALSARDLAGRLAWPPLS